MEEDDISDILIDDLGGVTPIEEKTNELKFINGKLYQKVNIVIYQSDVINIEERWDMIEGQ